MNVSFTPSGFLRNTTLPVPPNWRNSMANWAAAWLLSIGARPSTR